jgi:acyl-CoA thioester hydrolase
MSSSPEPSPFRHTLRVYWEDTDAGGVVFYANYLKFFERARTEWLRSFGHSQQRLREETGAIFIVAETHIRYLRPARLDDQLDVTVELLEAGRATMLIAQQALRGGESLAEGTIRIGCVDAATLRPRRIPLVLPAAPP